MQEKQIVKNTFTKGTVADLDPQKTSAEVMTYSLNGRVIYNRNGTLSWVNAKGTEIAIQLPFRFGLSTLLPYYIIGGYEISNYLVLISTQNTVNNVSTNEFNSEIGILTENSEGVYNYQTVFNDAYDFNGDLLHFNTRYQAKVQTILENKDVIRAYWCDDFNEDRVVNVVAANHVTTIGGVNYFVQSYLPYTTQPTFGNNGVQGTGVGALYPYWYSVHGMSELCDVQFGLIKYRKNIPGSKISGQRQYFYRLKHASGYATPWSPGSGFVMCTTPQVSGTDWTQYSMVASGSPTNKGHELEIKYIDTRFSFIEVAWAYYIADTIPKSAAVFFEGVITGTSMIVSDISENVVTPIPAVEELAQRYQDVTHSKTKLINENYQHKGNVALRGILEIDTSLITIEPLIRLMGSDNFDASDGAPTPYTQGLNVTDDSVDVKLFGGFPETYLIGGSAPSESDYINYKGTQWDCLFKGEFRGQTVPLAIVLFSRKGQPFFAQHIGDFTMPEQFGTVWKNTSLNPDGTVNVRVGDTRNNGQHAGVGDYTLTDWAPTQVQQITNETDTSIFIEPVLKILGKTISGIDLTDVLFDQYGELQLSGFSIVRADRIPNLLAQGLILNVSNVSGGNVPIVGAGNFITPLHSTGNAYFDAIASSGGQPSWRNTDLDHGSIDFGSSIVGNYFNLELPDNLFNPAIISNAVIAQSAGKNSGFQIQLVGNVQGNYVTDVSGKNCDGTTEDHATRPPQTAYTSFYTKNYITLMGIGGADATGGLNKSKQAGSGTDPVGTNASSPGDFGFKSPVEKIWLPFGNTQSILTDIDNFQFTRIAFLNGFFEDTFALSCLGEHAWHGLGPSTQVVVKVPGYANASLTANRIVLPQQNAENHICYYLCNILSGQPDVLNASVIQNRIYKNIGHFVPINAQTVAAATSAGRTIFNQVEVWGGDCYVDYFGYGRLIPLLDNVASGTPQYYDYGCGLIFPCETVYNHTMRIGNQFPGVSFRPGIDEDYSNNPNPVFYSGLYFNNQDGTDMRQEDFSLNTVMQASDKIDTFSVKGIYFTDEPDQPLLEMVSNVKTPGEIYDQFRLFLVNNQQLADSQYGFITDLQAIGHNMYVLQEKGFGRVRFNEYTQEVQPDGTNLTIGTGKGYQGHIYLGATDFGCQHEWSVQNNGHQIYWVNAYKGKHNRFGGNGLECLSDTWGQHQYFLEEAQQFWQIGVGPLTDGNENIYDNPVDVGGISSIFDYRNGANIVSFTKRKVSAGGPPAVITEVGDPSTMEFSDKQSSYQGNWSYNAGIYFSFKQDFFAYDKLAPANFHVFNEGARGSFFGVVYDSQLSFIVHNERQAIYDNAEMDVNPQAFGVVKQVDLETVNGNQTVILNNPLVDSRPVYRNSALLYPTMQNNQSTRMRGSYLKMTYTIDNVPNTEVLFNEHRQFIRKDFR